MKRRSLIFAVGMVVLLVLFWIGGDNGVVYVISFLGVPIVSGVLAGLCWIRFWLAALACLAVVALDVVFDETRAEDAVFFAVLAVVMVGIAAPRAGDQCGAPPNGFRRAVYRKLSIQLRTCG